MSDIIAIVIAYLLGSLSSAMIVSKYLKLPDPRESGSGNAGATNMLRLAGKNTAVVVLAGDVLKGIVAVLIGRVLGVSGLMLGWVALAAVVGHIYPVYFKFKGGKGVATMMGVLVMLSFWVGIIAAAICGAVAYFTRYASLASLIAAVAAPILMILVGNHLYTFPVFVITVLICYAHRENISRLRAGTESKF